MLTQPSILNRERSAILLVDPSSTFRQKVSTAFQNTSFRLLAASTALNALKIVSSLEQPALAIVEIKLPDMNGLELARRLYKIKPLPIIITTTSSDTLTTVSALTLVAEDVMRKPFDERELVARAIRLLSRVVRPPVEHKMSLSR